MDAFTLFVNDGASNGEMEPRVPNVAVEITRGYQLILEWDEVFPRYVIPLTKFKSVEQLCSATKVNIMHIQRLQDGLNALVNFY